MRGINIISLFENSIKNNWSSPALIETGTAVSYGELASSIIKLQLFWNTLEVKGGDKIAIVAMNCSNWVDVFFAAISSGIVVVIIQPFLESTTIQTLLNHSESRLVYCDREVYERIHTENVQIDAFIDIHTFDVLKSNEWIFNLNERVDDGFLLKYPNGLLRQDVSFSLPKGSDVCTIIYSSGTTGLPKGIMMSYDFFNSHIAKLFIKYPYIEGGRTICINPFSHIYGLAVDLIASLCTGESLVIVRNPSVEHLIGLITKYKPNKLFSVPTILHSIIENVCNDINKDHFSDCSLLDNTDEQLLRIKTRLAFIFGDRFSAFVVGGAAVSETDEALLIKQLDFPVVSAYASSECGIISLGESGKFKRGSCGKLVTQVKFGESSFQNQGRELLVHDDLFSGYFKDPTLTKAMYTADGWFKTGDLGYIDDEGNLFITGRCKDMLLTSNGENIYPAEIEETMNASPFVKESILVQRGEKLYAIVVPDREKAEADGLDAQGLNKKIDEVVREASKKLPGFTIISSFELRDEPLERTPKGSLKRYLYSDGIKEN